MMEIFQNVLFATIVMGGIAAIWFISLRAWKEKRAEDRLAAVATGAPAKAPQKRIYSVSFVQASGKKTTAAMMFEFVPPLIRIPCIKQITTQMRIDSGDMYQQNSSDPYRDTREFELVWTRGDQLVYSERRTRSDGDQDVAL